ncbi:MAG: ROK family transcriptional regulator [Eubacteriales bacterium]|nr:ROK family transcriptional regulator [Eubacteriales bacterium]
MEDSRTIAKNIGKVYYHIYRNKTSSRQAIASSLGFSLPTVTHYLNRLRESELIYNAGEFESTGGRKANMLSVVPHARFAGGIDITQSYVAFVLIDLNLNILQRVKIHKKYENTELYYQQIGREIEELINLQGIDREHFLGVGVSLPAIVGEGQNRVDYAEVINVPDNLYERMKEWIPYPLLMFNDANSAGWAELWMRGDNHPMAYLSLSNSVGGAIVMNRKVYTGVNWRAAEFGHMTVIPWGKKCYCGSYGCLNSYCSACVLSDFTNGDIGEFFWQMKMTGNRGYRNVFEEYMKHLALAVNNLRMCFDCDVVLGGNVGGYMEEYLEEFKKLACDLNPYEDTADYIKTGLCRTEPSAVGAALYFIDDFVRSPKHI